MFYIQNPGKILRAFEKRASGRLASMMLVFRKEYSYGRHRAQS